MRNFLILFGSVLRLRDVEWLLQDSAHEWREAEFEFGILILKSALPAPDHTAFSGVLPADLKPYPELSHSRA